MKLKKFQLPGKLKNLFLLLALSMFAACSFAQVNISGKVSSKSGNQTGGIAGISVTLKGTTYGEGTDNNGAYKFSAPIKPGKYTLVFSGVGY